jgi:hypothetical protein
MVPGWTERETRIAVWQRRDRLNDLNQNQQVHTGHRLPVPAHVTRARLANARVRMLQWFGRAGANELLVARSRLVPRVSSIKSAAP